jgi:translocation and assembly module TamB
VQILVGNDVWLRSSEAHIQLGGGVSVRTVKTRVDPGLAFDVANAAGDSVSRLALEGTLTADRGTYRLNLGVVQRTFRVEQGRVVFFGDAELNPTLDIAAVHDVRTAGVEDAGRDLRIRVRIFGTLEQPQIELTSADATVPMSTSDLISYLVTGAPSFELGYTGNENVRTAAAILLPTLGSYLGDRLAGGALDLFQIEAAGPSRFGEQTNGNKLDFLLGTRIGVGKQLGKRTFVSANTNLCQLDDALRRDLNARDFFKSLGVTLEHRLNNGFSAALSVEPGSTAMFCTSSTQRGFLSTPPQLGADLFKVWRF